MVSKGFKLLKFFILLILLSLLLSCSTISYYSQSVGGHLSVWTKRQDIQSMIDNPKTEAKLKQRLKLVLEIRQFASKQLGLPNNYSFHSYVDLKRKHIVWNVIAVPEFSVDPVRFCFPIVGCLSYKGYFSKTCAEKEAQRLKYKGLDVMVGGVTAYSTLGWFADPVLSTFIYRQEADLAGLIFHELAHQLIYLSGDTTFNESFASTVEIEGVNSWMKQRGTPKLSKQYFVAKKRDDDFMRLVLKTQERLKVLYARKIAVNEMRKAKRAVFSQMKQDYTQYKKRWQQYKGYDRYINSELNNAQIAGAATYFKYIKSFQNIFKKHNGNYKAFYQEVFGFAKLSIEQRQQKLNELK